jgi:predicted nucleic acid-binding protein
MSTIARIYWDSSCFISLLNQNSEPGRHAICTDILKHARDEKIEIWTSCWTIVETIRPRDAIQPVPLPSWISCLETKDAKGALIYPGAKEQIVSIWDYYHRHTRPSRLLSAGQAQIIKGMFAWSWIRKVQVAPMIAHKATEIARNYNIRGTDALHVASALQRGCTELHAWDKDFSATNALIPSKEPTILSPLSLFNQIP